MKVDDSVVPDFLIVGAAKSGTTSLYFYLNQHPQIFMSRVKEPLFFSFWDNPPLFSYEFLITRKNDYLALFENAKAGQLVGEASTSYLYLAKQSIQNIKMLYGNSAHKVKILILLRNPVERVWSHYMMDVRDGINKGDIQKNLNHDYVQNLLLSGGNIGNDYIGFGMYSKQIKCYLEEFDNVKIILHEDLLSKPDDIMQEVIDFLCISDFKINTNVKYNVSGKYRGGIAGWLANQIFMKTKLKGLINKYLTSRFKYYVRMKMGSVFLAKSEIDETLREKLSAIYKDEINELELLIDRDLSSWKYVQ